MASGCQHDVLCSENSKNEVDDGVDLDIVADRPYPCPETRRWTHKGDYTLHKGDRLLQLIDDCDHDSLLVAFAILAAFPAHDPESLHSEVAHHCFRGCSVGRIPMTQCRVSFGPERNVDATLYRPMHQMSTKSSESLTQIAATTQKVMYVKLPARHKTCSSLPFNPCRHLASLRFSRFLPLNTTWIPIYYTGFNSF